MGDYVDGPLAQLLDVVSRFIGQSDEGGLAWVEFSSLGVCSRAGNSRLQLRLFNWLAHRSISPYGSRAYGDGLRSIPFLI